MHDEIKEILRDILYWETCPEKYKEIIKRHLTDDCLIQDSCSSFNTERCNKDCKLYK